MLTQECLHLSPVWYESIVQSANKLESVQYMSRKGPEVGKGMLDFDEDYCKGVKSH